MKIRSFQQVCYDLSQASLIRKLSQLLTAQQHCFLVGGALRDMFLGRVCNDFDFITPYDPTPLAQALARDLSGHWFFVDQKRHQSRVVAPGGSGALICDFSPFRGPSLTADLCLRDFKINAITVRIHADTCLNDFYDPLNGVEDLALGQLSICSQDVLSVDPLRILKGARHCKTLQLTPSKDTVEAMRAAAILLPKVSKERVRKEMGLLFRDTTPAVALRWLREVGAAEAIFGGWIAPGEVSDPMLRLEAFGHNFLRLGASEHTKFFLNAMGETFEEGFSRQATLNLAMVLQGRSNCDIQTVIAGLKLSRKGTTALNGYLALPLSKLDELRGLTCGFRGRYWWVSELGSDPVGCLFYLAFSTFEYDQQLGLRALALAEEYTSAGSMADLVDGNWLCRCLEVGPGPWVGEALRALRYEEIAGRVRSTGQAKEFLQSRYKKIG